MKRFMFVVLMFTCAAVPLFGQGPPADPKFVKIDEVYKEKAHTPALWEDAVVLLPRNFKLDRSYQQASLNCAGGGAACSATAAGVPRGIHIAVSGGYYWSLRGNPQLLAAEVDDDDHVTRYKLVLPLFCGPGGNGEGCNIRVTVWAKSK
jgi:hypothetical protein